MMIAAGLSAKASGIRRSIRSTSSGSVPRFWKSTSAATLLRQGGGGAGGERVWVVDQRAARRGRSDDRHPQGPGRPRRAGFGGAIAAIVEMLRDPRPFPDLGVGRAQWLIAAARRRGVFTRFDRVVLRIEQAGRDLPAQQHHDDGENEDCRQQEMIPRRQPPGGAGSATTGSGELVRISGARKAGHCRSGENIAECSADRGHKLASAGTVIDERDRLSARRSNATKDYARWPNPRRPSSAATEWDRDAALTTARILLEIKAINFRPEEPYTFTSGWKSPVYIDCRRIIYFPHARSKICDLAVEKIHRHVGYETIEAVAGGETAGIPFAAWIADRMSAPMAYVRKKPKGFGQNALIEGDVPVGKRTLLVEDLTTDGQSKIRFANALRDAGAIVNHAFVVFFYGVFPGAFETLAQDGHHAAQPVHLVGRAGGLQGPAVFLRCGAVGGAAVPGEPGRLVGRAWRHRLGRGSDGAQGSGRGVALGTQPSCAAMTQGLGYAMGALLFFGMGDLIYKRGGAAGAQPHQLLMVQSWVFTPTVALYGLSTGTLTFVPGTAWGALAGLFVMIGFYNFAHSLKSGSISVNAPIFRLSFVITATLAVLLLGEPLGFFKVGGIALALAAAWLLLGAPAGDDAVRRHESRSSLPRVLLATLSIGIGNVVYKFGLRAGATPASLVVAQALVVVTLSTALAAVKDRRIRSSAVVLRYAAAAAVVLAVAFTFLVEGLARGDASVVVPVAQMGFGVTALLGFLFMREQFTARKGAGLIVALAALGSFAYGQPSS